MTTINQLWEDFLNLIPGHITPREVSSLKKAYYLGALAVIRIHDEADDFCELQRATDRMLRECVRFQESVRAERMVGDLVEAPGDGT